jgi:hypothetical protein
MEIPGARWHMTYPGSRPLGGGSLRPASNPVHDRRLFTGSRRRWSCVYLR